MIDAPLKTFVSLWVYLSGSPLLWLTVTLAAYVAADAVSVALRRHPLANPVLMAVVLVAGLLLATGTPYPDYFAGAQFVHFLLGPATVALAVPLVQHLPEVRRAVVPMLAALVVGSFTAIASAVLLARAFGLDRAAMLALAPKSSTAAIAMGIAEKIGGDPALTAVLVILTGITGAIVVTPLMNALRLKNYAARGFAAGLASHGIGTARAFQVDPVAGAFAGIALGLNGLLTALLVPVVVQWLAP
jgi:predicted murein hydrolase (TIGR00659 family)